jgi:hypothetical protein
MATKSSLISKLKADLSAALLDDIVKVSESEEPGRPALPPSDKAELKERWVPVGVETVLVDTGLSGPSPLHTANRALVARAYGMKNKSFTLRMSRTATLSTSGTGTMALSTAIYPSQFAQYSLVSDLFTEARLVRSRIQLADNQTSVGTVYRVSVMSAFHPTDTGAVTVSAATASQLPGCKLYSLANTNWPVTNSTPRLASRPWCKMTSTGSGTDLASGVQGAWWHVLVNTGPVSTNILTYIIEAEYEFRLQGTTA